MGYYPDLMKLGRSQKMHHVGWLDVNYPFTKAAPHTWVLEKLWQYCNCSLLHAGGFHECNITNCPGPEKKLKFGRCAPSRTDLKERYDSWKKLLHAKPGTRVSQACKTRLMREIEDSYQRCLRGYSRMILGIHSQTGQKMELGYAKIFVFGQRGKVYVAPNMIYHYVTVHHYKPPDEFIQALKEGPCPPEPEYIERLKGIGLPAPYVETLQQIWLEQQKKRAAQKRKSR